MVAWMLTVNAEFVGVVAFEFLVVVNWRHNDITPVLNDGCFGDPCLRMSSSTFRREACRHLLLGLFASSRDKDTHTDCE